MSLEQILSSAAWVALGGALAKLLDFVLARRREELTHAAQTYGHVNEAQKQLVDALFQQMKILQAEIDTLKEELAKCDAQHRQAAKRVDELEALFTQVHGPVQQVAKSPV